MKTQLKAAALVAAAVTALSLAGCSSNTGSSGGSDTKGQTITYWASNQAATLNDDTTTLTPELDKFTKQTGIKVKLEVIDWNSLYNRILTAISSGQGPDLLNIGNTWAVSLQDTGAFEPVSGSFLTEIGGKEHFLASSWGTTGAPGKTPTSVPLYGQTYSLYYNKDLFAAAGISRPPATWDEFVADAKKLTDPAKGQWGYAMDASVPSNDAQKAFIFGYQNGGTLFTKSGKPSFDSPGIVAGVKQWVDLIAVDHVVNPADATIDQVAQIRSALAQGKAAMIIDSSPQSQFQALDFTDYGVADVPVVDPLPAGGKSVMTHVAGENLSVFKNSKHKAAAEKLVQFLTSTDEQVILNSKYQGQLPIVNDAFKDPKFQTADIKVQQDILANHAEPMPLVAQEGQMETLVGGAVKSLIAQSATGKSVSTGDIKAALSQANAKMAAAG